MRKGVVITRTLEELGRMLNLPEGVRVVTTRHEIYFGRVAFLIEGDLDAVVNEGGYPVPLIVNDGGTGGQL